jgi:hypothetical protein
MKLRLPIALLATALSAPSAHGEAAAPCPGNADALGTARVLAVYAASAPRVGRKHFRDTLALAPKEVVLTFDDGPESGTTASVLDTLKRECVRASFFLLGRNALAHPELARRELAEGHTVAHHTFSHPCSTGCRQRQPRPRSTAASRGRHRALWPSRPPAADAVLPFPRFRLLATAARPAGKARDRGFRGRSMGERLEPDVAGAGASTRSRPSRGQSRRNRAVPRYQEADRSDAPALLRTLKSRDYRVVHVVPRPR